MSHEALKTAWIDGDIDKIGQVAALTVAALNTVSEAAGRLDLTKKDELNLKKQ